jgi:hypothetical protein
VSHSSSSDLILPRYQVSRPRFGGNRAVLLCAALLAILYGAAIALLASDFLLGLILPILILSLLVIWALPDGGTGPVRVIERLFFAFLVLLLLWPDYLALDVPVCRGSRRGVWSLSLSPSCSWSGFRSPGRCDGKSDKHSPFHRWSRRCLWR